MLLPERIAFDMGLKPFLVKNLRLFPAYLVVSNRRHNRLHLDHPFGGIDLVGFKGSDSPLVVIDRPGEEDYERTKEAQHCHDAYLDVEFCFFGH